MIGNNSTGTEANAKATTQAAQFLDSGWLIVAALEFYINYAMIGIGVVGTAANAVVLYALIVHNARETKKRMVNWLIINQNSTDLSCCVLVVICFSVKVGIPICQVCSAKYSVVFLLMRTPRCVCSMHP